MGNYVKPVEIQGTGMEERWGIKTFDYQMEKVAGEGMKQVDFRDLTTFISERRAVEIEKEVQPLAARINARNARLTLVGDAMSQLAAFSAQFNSDTKPETQVWATLSSKSRDIIYEVSNHDCDFSRGGEGSIGLTKAQVDKATQYLKTEMDKLNNESQLDMNRMQGVVQHRDESYNTATSMMTSVSDSISNAIKSMA